MIRFVISALSKQGFADIKADVDGYPEPTPIEGGSGVGHMPDVTGYKQGLLHIYEVETDDTISLPSTEDQWRIFTNFAETQGAKFVIVVPEEMERQAREQLARFKVHAQIWPVDVS